MHFNPADKFVENGGGEFGKVGIPPLPEVGDKN